MQAIAPHNTSYSAPQAPLSTRPTRTFRQLARKLEREVMQPGSRLVASMTGPEAEPAEQSVSDAVTACYVRGYN